MQAVRIPDEQIPTADQGQLVEQYLNLVKKIANRYYPLLERTGAIDFDDLVQVGTIAILTAQSCYDPCAGVKFITFLYNFIRRAIRLELGFNSQGQLPPRLESLDEPLSEETETTLVETIADPYALPMDEPIIEDENRRETSEQIRAALERMRSDKQREAVSLVWLEGKTRQAAADEMKMKPGAFYSLEKAARCTLRRDYQLRKHAESMPFVHVSLSRFNTTWTSSVEAAVLWREDHVNSMESEYINASSERHWTPKQELAYMNRLLKKHKDEAI